MLPVGPTSFGDSPYQSPSTFAGNPYFVDLDLLVKDGLLEQDEVDALSWGEDPSRVDYSLIYANRLRLLRRATNRGWDRDVDEVAAFVSDNVTWLPDYALFMAVKSHFGMVLGPSGPKMTFAFAAAMRPSVTVSFSPMT